MSSRRFLLPEARREALDDVRAIEARTSAEVKVVVRQRSGDYRAADYLAGAASAFAILLVLLFHPRPFAVSTMPLDVLAFFALGALASTRAPALRRALTPASQRRQNVRAAARAAFVDLGVSRTRDRNGLLVYVSLLERSVEVVTDVGIDAAALGPEWPALLAALGASVAPKPDFARFRVALAALGPVLGRAMPRRDDDVDELSNAVEAS